MNIVIKDWIDIVRHHGFFSSFNTDHAFSFPNPISGGNASDETNKPDQIVLSYDRLYRPNEDKIPKGSLSPSVLYAAGHQDHLHSENYLPHAESPAPAQSATVFSMWWCDDQDSQRKIIVNAGQRSDVIKHRTDGYPAQIEICELRKHYKMGNLHRKGSHPALRASRIFAHWCKENQPHRTNGPVGVSIRGYNEFWREGEFLGFKIDHVSYEWGMNRSARDINHFMENLHGKVDPLGNRFFTDPQDEIAFIAEFGS